MASKTNAQCLEIVVGKNASEKTVKDCQDLPNEGSDLFDLRKEFWVEAEGPIKGGIIYSTIHPQAEEAPLIVEVMPKPVRMKYYVPTLKNHARSQFQDFCADNKLSAKVTVVKNEDAFNELVDAKDDEKYHLMIDLDGSREQHNKLREFGAAFDIDLRGEEEAISWKDLDHTFAFKPGPKTNRSSSAELQAEIVHDTGMSEEFSESASETTRKVLQAIGAKSPTEGMDLLGKSIPYVKDFYVPYKQTIRVKASVDDVNFVYVDIDKEMSLDEVMKEVEKHVPAEHVDSLSVVEDGGGLGRVTERHHIPHDSVVVYHSG